MSRWYRFVQNNSGGDFKNDPYELIVEANSAKEANFIAERHIYFNGCETGDDCNCCGDRWSAAWELSEIKEPNGYNIFATEEEALKVAKERAEKWIENPEIKVVKKENGANLYG